MLTVFPAHAQADSDFAHQLSAFLETGCNVLCSAGEAVIQPGEDILSAAELGLSSDILVIILSRAANLDRWVRDRWEPLLFERASEFNTKVAVVMLEDCVFPQLLRRKLTFIDATSNRRVAMRQVKRWIWTIQKDDRALMDVSPDLESIYECVADQPGLVMTSGAMAERFATEAAGEFEAVFWVPAFGRNLTQIAGDLGAQMELRLDGQTEDNCIRICQILADKRCLVIFDGPEMPVEPLIPLGRSSAIVTREPVRLVDDEFSLEQARKRSSAGRFAEAYDLFRDLFDSGIAEESCARELVWICEHWGRIQEANEWRFHVGPTTGEQLSLF